MRNYSFIKLCILYVFIELKKNEMERRLVILSAYMYRRKTEKSKKDP